MTSLFPRLFIRLLLAALLLWLPAGSALSQEPQADPTPPTAQPVREHTVVVGDTLFGIAGQYGISLETLLQLNGLDVNTILQPGQTLVISGMPALPPGARLVQDDALLHHPDLPPVPKRHRVQPDETLTSLAAQYSTQVALIATANGLAPEAILPAGSWLTIPGVPGDLIALTPLVAPGETLAGLAALWNTRPDQLLQQPDSVPNPNGLVVGQPLAIISRTGSAEPLTITGTPHLVQPGETLTLVAAHHNLSPQALAAANGLPWPAPLYPGQRLRIPGEARWQTLPGHWQTLRISDPAPVQGETFALYVEMAAGGEKMPETISGTLRLVDPEGVRATYYYADYAQTIPFHPWQEGFVALVGLDGFVSPGLYELALSDRVDGVPTWRQEMVVRSGNYGIQLIRIPEEVANLLAPEVRSAEDAFLAPIYETITPDPLWRMDAPLQSPIAQAFITARYGAVRSYNDGPFDIFHNGVDYAAPVNTPILAAAAGVVVFSDFTPLRGNLVIIDHGWGVMTAYYHMEQRLVALGEPVEAGQAVGGLGNTGLSTGAHLHWDVRVRNVPVNGLQWLQGAFP